MSKVDRTRQDSQAKVTQSHCSVTDCTNPVRARGMCNGHWIKWRRANPNAPTLSPGNTLRATMLTSREVELFWSGVDKSQDCWTRGRGTRWYVKFPAAAGTFLGHRVAYELTVGPIPEGMVILHSCDNIRCVNPSHLRAGTKGDNNADMFNKGRNWQASVTHCPYGHEYTPENSLFHRGDKGLHCRTCHNTRSLARYHDKRAAMGA